MVKKIVKIMAQPESKYNLLVQEGDILRIPKQLQTVRLSGALLHPITVRYDERYHFINYVDNAGGYSEEAKPSKSYVLYANGSVDRTRSFLGIKKYPHVEPGAEIIVPQKIEKQKTEICGRVFEPPIQSGKVEMGQAEI